MIKQSSIDEVRSRIDIHDVVSKFVTLKKSGSSYAGLCPFHNEKSPSFRVTPSKQMFKCFGCGKGGDAIGFLMMQEKKTFVEAIEWLAGFYNVQLEYDQAAQQVSEETKSKKEEMRQLLQWAQDKFETLLHSLPDDAAAIQYLQRRGYDRERVRQWSLGFAPDDWKFITTPAINIGKHAIAAESSLVVSNDGKNYDFLRNRITVPIHDHNGMIVGFAGRYVPTGNDDEDKKQVKYLNPKTTLLYDKKKIWYGLWQAVKAIKDDGFVYVVEGYMDVQAMHDAGMMNTVASSGTEIDELQVRLLKRYADHVVICYDGDKAGKDKAMKQINLFLRMGCKVSVVDLPGGQDPDEYIRKLEITKKDIAA